MGTYRREPRADELTPERAEELGKCFSSCTYFINNYCKIYDSVESQWIPFDLWPAQDYLLRTIHRDKLTVILKARQLGISWLSLSYALWTLLFRPIAAISIFSRRETEAIYMLGNDRLRGMFANLPPWMVKGHETVVDSGREWKLSTGSTVRAFPTSAGDGYVSTLAIVDEADLAPDLNQLMRSVKPTIDNGGKMIMLSRSNKSEPESEFKRVYREAKKGQNGWTPVFLPWNVNPARTPHWYEMQRRDIMSRTGSLDDLYEQYPATDKEALAAKTLDKRIPPMWLEACFEELKPVESSSAPYLPNLLIYKPVQPGARYVMGADPAEGNPNSDDSSATVIALDSGEEVATMAGKFEPAVFAGYLSQLSAYYNLCPLMVERNNHGHSVIQWMEEHSKRTRLLLGHDAEAHKTDKKNTKRRKRLKAGWLSSTLGKTILYTICTEFVRSCAGFGDVSKPSIKVIHSASTFEQLRSIESATLRAPEGQHDDRADSFALAQAGRAQVSKLSHSSALVIESTKGWGF